MLFGAKGIIFCLIYVRLYNFSRFQILKRKKKNNKNEIAINEIVAFLKELVRAIFYIIS